MVAERLPTSPSLISMVSRVACGSNWREVRWTSAFPHLRGLTPTHSINQSF